MGRKGSWKQWQETSKMTEDDAKQALAKLFLAFPNSGNEAERKAKFDVYWDTLYVLPPMAVVAACDCARRLPGYLPSAGDLYAEACKRMAARRPLQPIPPPKHTPVNQEIVEKLKRLRAELISNEFKS